MTQHSLRPRDVSGIKEKRDPVYQISTLQSLILGNYYGCLYIEDLLKHGDTGSARSTLSRASSSSSTATATASSRTARSSRRSRSIRRLLRA